MLGARIEIRNLRKSFELGGRIIEVLRGVDVAIGAGGMVAGVGSSGGGKEAFLHPLGVPLARALIMEPRVLLADEPTGNLDSHTAEEIHGLTVELNRERGMTMVVVTHNADLANRMPRRLRMVDGKISDEAGRA